MGRRCPAQNGSLEVKHKLKLHAELRKAESFAGHPDAYRKKIGLAAFLNARKVPGGGECLKCTCGLRKQDFKHVLMFCPEREREEGVAEK